MRLIEEYIKLPKENRQKHLKLKEKCVFRNSNSIADRGLLAYFLDTTLPKGSKIQLCHACHNGDCSNPNHLYWGTARENFQDMINNGGTNIHERTVLKYGTKSVRLIKQKAGKQGGLALKGKPKSKEHKIKIREAILEWHNGV